MADRIPAHVQDARLVIYVGGRVLVETMRGSDGLWHIHHRDGRRVSVADRVEVIERLIATFATVGR